MKILSRLLLVMGLMLPLLACAAPNANAPLVEGQDYELIDNPAPFAPLAGKVEVVEVFGYTCGHCAHFEGVLQPWLAKLPAHVRFTPVPAVFGGHWDAYARAYYAAEQLGVAKRGHAALFDALHEKRSLPMQGVSIEQLSGFYSAYGVDAARYADALRSDAVNAKMKAARDFALRSGVRGTPTVIVNGKYRVRGTSMEDMLRITDALIAKERAASAR